MALQQQTRYQRMRQLQAEILRLQSELYVCERSVGVTYWPVPESLRSFVERFCGMEFLVPPLWQFVATDEVTRRWQQQRQSSHQDVVDWPMSDELRSIVYFDLHEGQGWISDAFDEEKIAHRALFCRFLALLLFYQHDANPALLSAGDSAAELWHWCEKASCEVEVAYWRQHGFCASAASPASCQPVVETGAAPAEDMITKAPAPLPVLRDAETKGELMDVAEKMREMVLSLGTFIVKMKTLLPDSTEEEATSKRIKKPRFARQHEPVAVRRHVSRVELHSAFVSSMSLLDELNASIDTEQSEARIKRQLMQLESGVEDVAADEDGDHPVEHQLNEDDSMVPEVESLGQWVDGPLAASPELPERREGGER